MGGGGLDGFFEEQGLPAGIQECQIGRHPLQGFNLLHIQSVLMCHNMSSIFQYSPEEKKHDILERKVV